MSVSIMSRSALISPDTWADKMSLSPKVISSVDTESFSLIMGIMPCSISFFVRFLITVSFFVSKMSEYVSRSWDTVSECSLKQLWYACIRRVCPMDAEHWFIRMSFVFCHCMWWLPRPIAPLETIVNCLPVNFRSWMSLARFFMMLWLNLPSLSIIVFVPILITIFLDFFSAALCRIASTFCFFVHFFCLL